jgi:hypothetical protein
MFVLFANDTNFAVRMIPRLDQAFPPLPSPPNQPDSAQRYQSPLNFSRQAIRSCAIIYYVCTI